MASDQTTSTQLCELKRVAVVGTSGSGKTTFARELARRLDSPHVELDSLHWLPNWQERNKADFQSLIRARAAEDTWVIDGNHAPVHDIVWSRATAIVWLDYPLPIAFWRGLVRSLRRIVHGETIFNGNRETIGLLLFSRDSILRWIITSHPQNRRQYEALFHENQHRGVRLLRFRRPSEASEFLRSVAHHDEC